MGGGGRGGWEGVEGGVTGLISQASDASHVVNEGAHSRPLRHPRFFIHLKKINH